MGTVVSLAHHVRASLVANPVRISAVKPASRARGVAKIGPQCSGGIRSLWDHLRAVSVWTPISPASTMLDGQSLTTARNDLNTMPQTMGQKVPRRKHFLSHDQDASTAHVPAMVDELEYKRQFIARVREGRARRPDWRQEDIAELLGTDRDTYKQWETRTFMPRHLMPLFCKLTGLSLIYLLTGMESAERTLPVAPADAVLAKPRRKAKKSQKAS